MAKNQKDYGVGVSFIGTPDELIKRIAENKKEQKTALDTIINEGPPHKQLYSALLLKNMFKLVQAVEKHTGQSFSEQEGTLLTSEKDEIEIAIPFVPTGVKSKDREAVEEVLSHAPAHEIAAFNTLLQATAWAIGALEKNK